jgi:hypothetical protein
MKGDVVGGFIGGAVAVVVGGALAFATVIGVVNVVNGSPSQPDASVMNYGTTE